MTSPLSYTIVPFPWGLYCPETLPVYIPLSPREPVNGRFVVSNVLMSAMVVFGSTFLASSLREGLGTSSGFGSDLRDDGLAALRVVMALRSMLSPEPKLSLTFSAGGAGGGGGDSSSASSSPGSAAGSTSSSSSASLPSSSSSSSAAIPSGASVATDSSRWETSSSSPPGADPVVSSASVEARSRRGESASAPPPRPSDPLSVTDDSSSSISEYPE
mmetsp:Transcript_3120/g.6979  ORF Transcript_3120/g.6979 Transcript_3120/m.6979 type:complete len:216 (+) Transcript_3120:1875-2522(+)